MTRLICKSLNVLLILLIIIITKITKTSANVFRPPQESTLQLTRSLDQQNEPQVHSSQFQSQSLSSKPVYDTLASIDERIRLLEAYDNTYKLTKIDFTLEQLSQRIVSIESKLSRMENSLDSKIGKLEELAVTRARTEELETRKIEDLGDRIELNSKQFETKFESKIDKIVEKLDSLERYIHSNGEDMIDKWVKYEERHIVFESHVKSHIINIENLVKHSLDANTNIKEIVSYDFDSVDKLVNTVKESHKYQNSVVQKLASIANQIQNSSALHQSHGPGCHEQRKQINYANSVQTIGTDNGSEEIVANNGTNSRISESEPKIITNSEIYDNISSTLEQLRQLGVDERLTQLDVRVDYFSRKIINTIQDIWLSSESSESYLRQALDMANKTRSFIRQEFRRIQELIGPLTKTPDLSEISESLEQKLYQMSTTIDDSFNALMISQNSFISSCTRIQEEEEQLYDVLDDMLIEIRNKSSLDVQTVKESVNGLSVLMNQTLTQLQSQIKSLESQIIANIKTQIQLLIGDRYSTAGSVPYQAPTDRSDCFLTRNQLISVCNKNENNLNSDNTKQTINTNNEQLVDEEKSEEKLDPIYEDLTHTE